MRYFILSPAALLLFACTFYAQGKDTNNDCQGVNKQVAVLINEYQELRERRNRLPQGSFDADVQAAGGKLSRVLSSLGTELGHRPFTKRLIVRCLGKPDAIKRGKEMSNFLGIYNRQLRKAGQVIDEKRESEREYLIYFWRGWHDFLFFISEGGSIVDHGWWFAYE